MGHLETAIRKAWWKLLTILLNHMPQGYELVIGGGNVFLMYRRWTQDLQREMGEDPPEIEAIVADWCVEGEWFEGGRVRAVQEVTL